jgi:DNA-binding response OmpR family regulator
MALPRVLVADASRPVRYLLARLIEEAGYEVVEKVDGIETLRALQDSASPYTALVVAAMLPLLPARVLLERARPCLRETLVLVVTASSATLRAETTALADLGLEGRAIEAHAVCVEVLRALGELRARR